MNKGDFVGACLPYSLVRKGVNQYAVMTYSAVDSGAIEPAGLTFTIPAALMTQLQNEGLVSPARVLLYDDSTDPFASQQNRSRYLAVLGQLVPIAVTK